jgi:hypothetical protein
MNANERKVKTGYVTDSSIFPDCWGALGWAVEKTNPFPRAEVSKRDDGGESIWPGVMER